MITRAEISHYKSINDATIDFGPVNVIVGTNGAGKSNIIDALYFVRDCIVDDLDTAITRRHGIESIRQWSKTKPYNISIKLHVSNYNGSGYYNITIGSFRGSFKVLQEQGYWHGSNVLGLNTKNGEEVHSISRFERKEDGSYTVDTDLENISDKFYTRENINLPSYELLATSLSSSFIGFESVLFNYLFSEIKNFSSYSIYPNTLRQPQSVSRDSQLRADGSNMASIIKKINTGHKKNKESLLRSLKIALPIVSDIIVKSAGGYYVPVIRAKESNGESHELNMSQISDGTLRVLGILSALYQIDKPNIVALEEPEQMVHPGILPVITDAIQDFVFDKYYKRQVFVTTHSPTLLDQFNPKDIIWANYSNGITSYGKISERQLEIIKNQLFTAGELLLAEGIF